MIYDVIIIGGGAAGLSAALYAGRAKLNTLVLEKNELTGGQIVYSEEVDNYLGIPDISGFNLMEKFRIHAKKQSVEFREEKVKNIIPELNYILVGLTNGTQIRTHTVVLATGARHNKLNIVGEKEYKGKGISYCATCDGAFYKNKEVAVIGGGDTALEETLYLANICSKVYLVHRRNELRGNKTYQDKINEKANIEFIGNTVVENIVGNKRVTAIECRNIVDGTLTQIDINGVFVAIGMKPVTFIADNILEKDSNGYIVASEDGVTNVRGIFVAGDIRTKELRQLITAVSDGANCIYSVEKYLSSK